MNNTNKECSKCEYPDHCWTRADGKKLEKGLKPIFKKYGYDLKLVGSLSKQTHSCHDADLLATPIKCGWNFEPIDEILGGWFEEGGEDGTEEVYQFFNYPADGRIVDIFFGKSEFEDC